MGLTRDTPLLTTVAQVVDLTAVTTLANVEASGEFSAADTLLEAHRWVYDRLKRRYPAGSLAGITNTVELQRAVAFRFLEALAAAGHVAGGEDGTTGYWGTQAREEVDSFQPEFSPEQDVPRVSGEGVPSVTNVSRRALFGGQLS